MSDEATVDPVLVIRLDETELYGSTEDLSLLTETLRHAMNDEDTKVIVLRLVGSASPPGMMDGSTEHAVLHGTRGLFQTVCFSRRPVVVAVDGECAGRSMLLALYADVTVASSRSTFRPPLVEAPEANLVLAMLSMRLNRAKAWLLGDGALDAASAFTQGLVAEIAPHDLLDVRAMEIAADIARIPLDALCVSKTNVNACMDTLGVGREFDLVDVLGMAALRTAGGAR